MSPALVTGILVIGSLLSLGGGYAQPDAYNLDYEMSLSVIERHKRLDIPVRHASASKLALKPCVHLALCLPISVTALCYAWPTFHVTDHAWPMHAD